MQVGIVTSYNFALGVNGPLTIVRGAGGDAMLMRGPYDGSANPTIYIVTSLADSGPNTLRQFLEFATEPRFILMGISGDIILESDINIRFPYVSVIGCSAPGQGIALRGLQNAEVSAGGIQVLTHHVYIDHLVVRPGDGGPILPQVEAHDAIVCYGQDLEVHHIVFNHLTLGWASGKLAQWYKMIAPGLINVWKCLLHEALYYGANVIVSPTQPASLAMHVAGANPLTDVNQCTVYGSLLAHCSDRNPEVEAGSDLIFMSNLVFDWGRDTTLYSWASFMYGSGDYTVKWQASFVSCKYISGPSAHPFLPLYAIGVWAGNNQCKLYMHDIAVDSAKATVVPFYLNPNMGFDPTVLTPPRSLAGLIAVTTDVLEDFVLTNCGSMPYSRDSVDQRIVNDVRNRTGTVISSPSQVGGYPTRAVIVRTPIVPANPHSISSNGYTNLENQIYAYQVIVEAGSTGGGGGGGGQTVSPNQTYVPPSDSITDSSLNTWTIVGGEVFENGGRPVAAFQTFATYILYYNTNIYVYGDDNQWYLFTGTSWTGVGVPDPSL